MPLSHKGNILQRNLYAFTPLEQYITEKSVCLYLTRAIYYREISMPLHHKGNTLQRNQYAFTPQGQYITEKSVCLYTTRAIYYRRISMPLHHKGNILQRNQYAFTQGQCIIHREKLVCLYIIKAIYYTVKFVWVYKGNYFTMGCHIPEPLLLIADLHHVASSLVVPYLQALSHPVCPQT